MFYDQQKRHSLYTFDVSVSRDPSRPACLDWSLARENHDNKLEFRELFPVIGEHGLNITGVMNVLAEAWLANNPNSKSVRYLDQPIHKVLDLDVLGLD